MTKYGNEMSNSELLAYGGPDNLLRELEKQRRYVLRIEASPRECPNCGTAHTKWEIHGITNVNDYDMSNSHGDEGKCKACGRGLIYCVPFVGSPYLSLVPDSALAANEKEEA